MKYFLLFLLLFLTNSYASSWDQVNQLFNSGFDDKLFSGAFLYVGNSSSLLFKQSVGDSSPDKLYDVASLTKVMATTFSIMILEERGELSTLDKVSKYFPGFASGSKDIVTLEDLMRHQAGLPSGARPLDGEKINDYITRITMQPLLYKPRTKTVYSDLSFILLGKVVELVSAQSLSSFAVQNIFLPLKMNSTSYVVALDNQSRCAPTNHENFCLVHDPTAFHFLPGTIGNAGVYTSINDLSRFARMVLRKGELDGVRILSEKTVLKMTTAEGTRGLGWDITSEYSTKPRGEAFPAGISFGHTGYTGTTIWIDPKSDTFYVFLSNRVYMGDEATKKPFGEYRMKLSTAIGSEIYSPQ
jgi:CubicO group peptidase (beta-lactamase class C family)